MQRAAARLTKNCTVHFKTQPRKTMARLKNSHVCRRRRCWSLKWEEMHRGEGDRGRLAHYLPHYSHAPIIHVCRRTTFLHSRVQSALHMHEGRNSPPPPLFIIQTPRFPSVLAKSNNGILKQMHEADKSQICKNEKKPATSSWGCSNWNVNFTSCSQLDPV